MPLYNYLQKLNARAAQPLIRLIRLYQLTLSPDKSLLFSWRLKGRICHHTPHCSAYGIQVLQRYGLFPGIVYMIDRITSCTGGSCIHHDPAVLRVVFASSAPIGVPFLQKIASDPRYDLVGVMTNPDVPSGRGMKVRPNIIKTAAEELMKQDSLHHGGGMAGKQLNIIILHGQPGDPEGCFYPQLQKTLEQQGHTVSVPLLPQPETFAIEKKVEHLLNNISRDDQTIIIGHSFGSLIAMKVIEKLEQPIRGCISIAGMYDRRVTEERRERNTPGTFAEYDQYKKEYGPIIRDEKNLEKNCNNYTILGDKNDPAVPPSQQKKLGKLLNCTVKHIETEAPHCTGKNEPNIINNIQQFLEDINKTNIIIFHGKKRPQKNTISEWILNTKEKLTTQGYNIITPHIDRTREIGRKEREDTINQYKHLINNNTILIGHSAGGAALTRWLGENDVHIKKLILVAPGKIASTRHQGMVSSQTGQPIGPNDNAGMRNLYDFTIDTKLHKKTTDGITLYTSNDSERLLESAELYKQIHNITHIELEDRGHFNSSYGPQNATFPELIEEIQSSHIGPKSSDPFITTPQSLRLQSKKYGQDAKDFDQRLKNKQPDLLVVIAYGKIIPQHILDIPAIAPINVHGSLLPKYRGASPIQSVLLDDESETGITIMRMEAGLDTGPMLSKQKFPLTIHTTALNIIERFQDFGPQQLVDTMRDYAKGHIDETPQDDSQSTHCSKLTKTDGLIDPRNHTLHQINNIYRGCYLRPKAHFVLPESRGDHAGKTITIDQMTLDDTLREQHKDTPLLDDTMVNPAVLSLTVKPANKKAMSWSDFLLGYRSNS